MHATIEQLLVIRDGETVAADLRQHVDLCVLCQERLDTLVLTRTELRRLPALTPGRDLWADILSASQRRRQLAAHRRRWVRYSAYGLAASVLLACIVLFSQSQFTGARVEPAVTPQISDHANSSPNPESATVSVATETELQELIVRSARLEAALHALPQRPRVMRASTTEIITGLQNGVALVDYQLNLNTSALPATATRQLWQQRVDLMNSLVNVRYAEAQRVAYNPN